MLLGVLICFKSDSEGHLSIEMIHGAIAGSTSQESFGGETRHAVADSRQSAKEDNEDAGPIEAPAVPSQSRAAGRTKQKSVVTSQIEDVPRTRKVSVVTIDDAECIQDQFIDDIHGDTADTNVIVGGKFGEGKGKDAGVNAQLSTERSPSTQPLGERTSDRKAKPSQTASDRSSTSTHPQGQNVSHERKPALVARAALSQNEVNCSLYVVVRLLTHKTGSQSC